MSFSSKSVVRGALWTIGTYGASVVLRFGSNVVLSRLVMPEVFGVMLILNTLRSGLELLSDVGIGQNVVQHKKGESQSFRDVAWTIQLVRGLVLFSILFLVAAPLGQLYQLPATAMQLSAVTLALMGACSLSIYLMQRRMQFARLNLFDLAMDAISAIVIVGFALISPTIWSLILANVVATAIRMGATYLLPEARNWFSWDREHARDIISFGKWIYVWSLLSFLCASFDKLYLGQSIPLAMLGIYGLARTVAELPTALFGRLGHSVVFPVIAAQQDSTRDVMRERVGGLRFKLLLFSAGCLALGIAFADYAIMLIYDPRYHDAAWMLPVMLIGAWATILCSMNEYLLLGVGKPLYGASGNLTKLVVLIIGVPLGLHYGGLLGSIVVLVASDFFRYGTLQFGQQREKLSFFRQDALLSAVLVVVLAVLLLIRWQLGWGSPFDGASF